MCYVKKNISPAEGLHPNNDNLSGECRSRTDLYMCHLNTAEINVPVVLGRLSYWRRFIKLRWSYLVLCC
ncbi:hypothetical protein DAI22_05g148600 [Oryza sativa Japonica Group]|nr:hypothetical protein DAI22_05g148600 [Oryza sativa Japonica Group]